MSKDEARLLARSFAKLPALAFGAGSLTETPHSSQGTHQRSQRQTLLAWTSSGSLRRSDMSEVEAKPEVPGACPKWRE